MHMKRSKQLHRRFWGDDAKRFHLHLHSLTDRIEVFNLSKILHMRVNLSQALSNDWAPKFFIFKVRQLTNRNSSNLFSHAQGRRERWRGGCFDWGLFGLHIFNQRVAKKFLSNLPQPDHWYPDTTPGENNLCGVKFRHADKETFGSLKRQ